MNINMDIYLGFVGAKIEEEDNKLCSYVGG